MELFAYIRIVFRHFWVVIMVAAAALGGALYYIEERGEVIEYAATATLFINPMADNPMWPYQRLDAPALAALYDDFLTESDFPETVATEMGGILTVEELQAAISTGHEEEEQYFYIIVTHEDPLLAQQVANLTAELFVAENNERIQAQQQRFSGDLGAGEPPLDSINLNLQSILQEELSNINRRIDEVQTEIGQLQDRPRSEQLDRYISSLVEEMFELRSQRAEVLANMPTSLLIPASLPEQPLPQESDLRIMLQAIVLGGMLGVGMTFLLEYLDNSIHTPDTLTKIYGLETQSTIGKARSYWSWTRRKSPQSNIVVVDSNSPLTEAFRMLRIRLSTLKLQAALHSIMITSATKGEGKTFVATNLAVSLAQNGIQTILVDTNLARPAMHTIFDLPQEPGLVEAVRERTTKLEEALSDTHIHNLRVLPCGSVVSGASDILGSPDFVRVMEQLSELADVVVYDTAALNSSTDTLSFAAYADAVFQVVLANKTSIRMVQRGRELLYSLGAPTIGPILNRANRTYPFSVGATGSIHSRHSRPQSTPVKMQQNREAAQPQATLRPVYTPDSSKPMPSVESAENGTHEEVV